MEVAGAMATGGGGDALLSPPDARFLSRLKRERYGDLWALREPASHANHTRKQRRRGQLTRPSFPSVYVWLWLMDRGWYKILGSYILSHTTHVAT